MPPKKALLKKRASKLGLKPYPCTRCNRSYWRAQPLRAHMTTHLANPPFKCTLDCPIGYVAPNRQNLLKHQKSEIHRDRYAPSQSQPQPQPQPQPLTGISPKVKVSCDTCGQMFAYPREWKNHLQVHKRDAPLRGSPSEFIFEGYAMASFHTLAEMKAYDANARGKGLSDMGPAMAAHDTNSRGKGLSDMGPEMAAHDTNARGMGLSNMGPEMAAHDTNARGMGLSDTGPEMAAHDTNARGNGLSNMGPEMAAHDTDARGKGLSDTGPEPQEAAQTLPDLNDDASSELDEYLFRLNQLCAPKSNSGDNHNSCTVL